MTEQQHDHEVIIFGAGVAGLCTGIKLREAGITNFTILEKADAVGGTWRDNSYPGSGCDVPSHLYSFSFEPKTDWSRKYGKQDEIEHYLNHCADKYGIRPHIQFNTEVESASFDEAINKWTVRTKDGRTLTATSLVSGVGQLNRPAYPDIPGLDTFQGTKFHSARWNHDHDLSDETVAVIGNGASAIQFVPEIAPKVKQLYIYQRTPNWIVPKPDRLYSQPEQKLWKMFPFIIRLHRWLQYLTLERNFLAFRTGSFFGKLFEKQGLKAIEEAIDDPDLRQKLTPDYPAGCKRILLSNDWLPALARDNVEVVTARASEVSTDSIADDQGVARKVDTIIYATGFEATQFLAPMDIHGLGGVSLNAAWAKGAEAHRGITLTGFPNFYMLYGPNTNLGHNSIIFMIECQVNYALKCIKALRERKLAYLDVKKGAQSAFNETLQNDLARSVWAEGCGSWYKNAEGKVTNNWSSFTARYWWETRNPDFAEYNEIPQT